MNRSRVSNTAGCPPGAVINHGPGGTEIQRATWTARGVADEFDMSALSCTAFLGDCFVEFTAYSHSSSEQRHGISRRRELPPLKIGSEPQFDQSVRIAGASALFNLSSGSPTVAFYWRGSAGPVATDAPRNTR